MKIDINNQKLLSLASRTDMPVLLRGQTGSGKTTLARKIHEDSVRRDKPFIVVDLATLHEGTIESELFGHERGAFTGADRKRVGLFEMADGGTVFLDEIGELSLKLQARLLQFLQSRVIRPIGATREIKLDVRVIAATHRDLEKMVKSGDFREDLFHRLRVLPILLPSLSVLTNSFDEIVHGIIEKFARSSNKKILSISCDVARLFEAYPWPGNYRELNSTLEYAIAKCESSQIEVEDLPDWFLIREINTLCQPVRFDEVIKKDFEYLRVPVGTSYHEYIDECEKRFFQWLLRKNGGKINESARIAKISKGTMIERLKRFGIDRRNYFFDQRNSEI